MKFKKKWCDLKAIGLAQDSIYQIHSVVWQKMHVEMACFLKRSNDLECTFHSLCCIFVLLELQEPAKHLSNRSVDGLWPKKTYVWILYCDAPKGKARNGSMWQQTCHTVTSLSSLTFRCNSCHVQMYVQPILNFVFTNAPHIYAKQIPSQKSSHHETLDLIIALVCTSSYLSQAQPKRETRKNPSIIPQTRVFLPQTSHPWPTIPCRHRWIQTKMLKQKQLEMKRKLRTSAPRNTRADDS